MSLAPANATFTISPEPSEFVLLFVDETVALRYELLLATNSLEDAAELEAVGVRERDLERGKEWVLKHFKLAELDTRFVAFPDSAEGNLETLVVIKPILDRLLSPLDGAAAAIADAVATAEDLFLAFACNASSSFESESEPSFMGIWSFSLS